MYLHVAMLIRFLAILLLALPCAQAESHVPLPVARLAAEAELIVTGRVHGKMISKDPEGRIFTQVDLAVGEIWKGAWAKPELALVHGGGILGEIGTKIIGQAEYDLDEEVLLFLAPDGKGRFVTIGMSDGKFTIYHPAGAGNSESAREGGAVAIQTGTTRRLPLAELRTEVQTISNP